MRGVGRGSPRGVGRGSPPAVGRGQQSRPQQPQTSPQVADVLAQMTGLLNSLTLRVTQKEVHEPPKFNLTLEFHWNNSSENLKSMQVKSLV